MSVQIIPGDDQAMCLQVGDEMEVLDVVSAQNLIKEIGFWLTEGALQFVERNAHEPNEDGMFDVDDEGMWMDV